MPYYPLVIGAVSAGTTRAFGPEVVLSNSNGVSFGVNGSTITAQHNALTSQSAQIVSGSDGSYTFQTLVLSNANGISFGTSAGPAITASHNALTSQSAQAASASNGSFAFQTLGFSDANGITFGTSAGSIVTASHAALTSQSAQAASASNGSFAFQTLAFSNANGITFGTSAGSIISASHNGLTAQSAQAASASNGSFAFETLGFSNANGVTFGTSAGSIITASVAAGAALTNIKISAGTSSANLSDITFSDSNGLSFGLNGSTVTASPLRVSFWEPHAAIQGTDHRNGSLHIQRLYVPNPINASQLDFVLAISGSANGAASFSIAAALYTMNVSTAGTVHSTTRGFTYQSTSAQSFSNYSGTRYHSLAAPWNVTPGEYLFGWVVASTSASTNSTVSMYGRSQLSINAASGAGGNYSSYFGHGVFTAATSITPATFQLSDLLQTGNNALRQPYIRLIGTF